MKKGLFPAILSLLFFVSSCKKDAQLSVANPSNDEPTISCSTCKIFITATTSNGSFGGAAAADAICNADANKPTGGGTYKAMLADGTDRRACTTDNCSTGGTSEHIDWVLKPNTTYTSSSGTTIATTDANGLFSSSISQAIGSAGVFVWTGITYQQDFGAASAFIDRWINSNGNCNNWTDNSNLVAGEIGQGEATDYRYISGGNPTCNNNYKFYCVEQ